MGILDDVERRRGARQRHGIDQFGQSAPPRIRIDLWQRHVGVGDAEQIDEQQQILRIGIGHISPHPCAGGFAVQVGHTAARPQQSRHRLEGNVAGVRLAKGPKHLEPPTGRQRGSLPRYPGFTDARRSHHVHDPAAATDRAVHKGVEGSHLPAPTDQVRIGAPELAFAWADGQQAARAHRFVCPLDVHPFGFGQQHGVLDQPRGRLREHHPARGRHRFHPLGKTDGLAGRGVAQGSRTDVTGDHPTGVQAHPQLQCHAIAALHLGCQSARLVLDGQRRKARPKSVILQRNWGAEQRHHPVARLLRGPAVALHHHRRPLHQLGHDFAQPLHVQRGRDVHRAHHVSEQHRHLLVLRRVDRCHQL